MFETETDPKEEPQLNPYMIPSQISDLQVPSDGMHQALFTIEHSKRFISEVGSDCEFRHFSHSKRFISEVGSDCECRHFSVAPVDIDNRFSFLTISLDKTLILSVFQLDALVFLIRPDKD